MTLDYINKIDLTQFVHKAGSIKCPWFLTLMCKNLIGLCKALTSTLFNTFGMNKNDDSQTSVPDHTNATVVE